VSGEGAGAPRAGATPGSGGHVRSETGRADGRTPETVSGERPRDGTPAPRTDTAPGTSEHAGPRPGGHDPRTAPASAGDPNGRGDTNPNRTGDGARPDGTSATGPGDIATSRDGGTDPRPGHLDPDGIRRFDSDADGERYGEDHLGETFRNLPPELQNAVRWYTRQSFPNPFLRPGSDLGGFLRWAAGDVQPGWHLFEMHGGRAPSIADIYAAVRRADLTPEQRHIVNDVLNHADPESRLEAWLDYSGQRGFLTRYFGTFPAEADFWHRIDEIDRALNQRLPEGVQIQRGLHDVRFMIDAQGNPVGGGDPRSLVGTTQTEQAYMSTSLGENPTVVDGKPFAIRLHLNLPVGSPGL
jgi:hypothetical protein